MDIWLFPSLFPPSKEKGAEAERGNYKTCSLINFFLLKLKSYIKTLFPTHSWHYRSSFSWGRGREDNRTIRHQICPNYDWEKKDTNQFLTNQQKSINGQNNKSSPVIFVLYSKSQWNQKWTVSQLFHIFLLFITNLIRVKSKTEVQTKNEYGT